MRQCIFRKEKNLAVSADQRWNETRKDKILCHLPGTVRQQDKMRYDQTLHLWEGRSRRNRNHPRVRWQPHHCSSQCQQCPPDGFGFRGERIVFLRPNTNTIWVQKFVFKMTDYEYKYYLGSEVWSSMNTNIIRSATFVRRWIIHNTNITECEYQNHKKYQNL